MSALGDELKVLIGQDGPISLERYMALALTHPAHGYYMNRDPFGAEGDFTTAPEISQMFGELIGLWAAEVWAAMGNPNPLRLIELGPGRGTLMSDALRAARVAPEFRAALDWDADLAEAKSGLVELRSRCADQAGRDSPCQPKSSASTPIRQAIVVLGMHRSGTSALTGVLCGLGAAAPKKTLMGPDPCNLKGIFEALSLAQAHDRFLAAAGSCWQDWRKFDLQWAHSQAAAEHSAKIRAVLIDEFGDEPMIVLKDPRICRFLPYTLSLLADLNVIAVAVLPVRNPLEVALSLQRRNDFAVPMSIMLWLRHVLDAEYLSRSLPRYFLSYDGLLQNWRYHIDRIAEQTGVAWPNRSDRSDVEIDQFLTTELYHERATWDETMDHREVLELARHTYRILMDICTRGESSELRAQLDAARTQFDDSCRTFEAPMAEENVAQTRP